jgi:hypothetical protein
MKEEVILRILVQESPQLELWLQRYGFWKLLGAKRSFQEGSGIFSEILRVVGGSWCKR